MSFEVLLNPKISKTLNIFSKSEKQKFVETINTLQKLGRIGFPFDIENGFWRISLGSFRIFYKIEDKKIIILKLVKGIGTFDATSLKSR